MVWIMVFTTVTCIHMVQKCNFSSASTLLNLNIAIRMVNGVHWKGQRNHDDKAVGKSH